MFPTEMDKVGALKRAAYVYRTALLEGLRKRPAIGLERMLCIRFL